MASIAFDPEEGRAPGAGLIERERKFFLYMAIACAVPLVIGFSTQFAFGRSKIDSPWWVHAHGMSFTAWMLFYIVQNWLVVRGSLKLHRTLGVIGAVWMGWLVVIGVTATTMAVILHRVPFFFEANVFLVMDTFNIVGAAALVWLAVRLRKSAAWHKRLMLCSMIFLTGPGWGRFLPMPLVGPYAVYLAFAPQLIYWAIGMVWDARNRGRVHSAYAVGGLVLIGLTALMRPIAFTQPVMALTDMLASG